MVAFIQKAHGCIFFCYAIESLIGLDRTSPRSWNHCRAHTRAAVLPAQRPPRRSAHRPPRPQAGGSDPPTKLPSQDVAWPVRSIVLILPHRRRGVDRIDISVVCRVIYECEVSRFVMVLSFYPPRLTAAMQDGVLLQRETVTVGQC